MSKQYAYELEVEGSKKNTYFVSVSAAKMVLWAQYMNTKPKDVKEVQASWRQLVNEWSISGIGEIRPIIPDGALQYQDLGI